MTEINTSDHRLSPKAKALVDFGPLAIFLIAYFFGHRLVPFFGNLVGKTFTIGEGNELFLAVSAFLPAFTIAFIYSVWKERRIAPMLAVTGVAVGVLGSLTLILQNKTFFYMKPTIIYALFSVILWVGLSSGKNFLKILFDGALHLPDDAWRTLTIRYAIFFSVLAITNELIWRWLMRECDLSGIEKCAGEATWVNVKVFGFSIANIIFAALQGPIILKHIETNDGTGDKPHMEG